MKKIAFICYRQWSFDIYEAIVRQTTEHDEYIIPLLITTPEHEFPLPQSSANLAVEVLEGKDYEGISVLLAKHEIDVVMFYGWSWIVKEPILTDYICLCLHPSPLPKYRGGTPIQHQIVAGEDMSAVSIIKMSEGIDDGDIYKQIPFSLAGDLNNILSRMVDLGTIISLDFLQEIVNGQVTFTPQSNLDGHPPLKRRKQTDGEIDLVKAKDRPYKEVYNLVRGLIDPYPNAYITLADGTLYLQKVKQRKVLPEDTVLLSSETKEKELDSNKPLALKVCDGFALITKSRFESQA